MRDPMPVEEFEALVRSVANVTSWRQLDPRGTVARLSAAYRAALAEGERKNVALANLARACLEYDKALESCGDDPDRMASYCTATGDDLDALYFKWQRLAYAALRGEEG